MWVCPKYNTVFIIIFITYSSIIYPQNMVEVCLILNFDDNENNIVVTPIQFSSVQCTSDTTSIKPLTQTTKETYEKIQPVKTTYENI